MHISLIVPCYNEVSNLQKGVLDKIGNFTKDDPRFLEVIIADDGSNDESVNIIETTYLSTFPKFRIVKLSHRGKAMTVIDGIKAAKAEWVLFCDMDLATPIEEVEKLVTHTDTNATAIIGSRGAIRPNAPIARKIMAIGMIVVRTLIVGLHGIKDTQCGFKLIKRETALNAFEKLHVFRRKGTAKNSSVSAIFDLEFLFVIRKVLQERIVEVPVIWRHVETRRVDFVRDTIESLTDMMRMKYYLIKGKYA